MSNNKCCETTVSQKSISDNISFSIDENNVLTLIVGNRVWKVQIETDGDGGGGNQLESTIAIPIISNGQSSFNDAIPINSTLVNVYLNGVRQNKTNYSTSGIGDRILIWLDTVQQPLETSDYLEIDVVTTIIEEP